LPVMRPERLPDPAEGRQPSFEMRSRLASLPAV
jgi:hypothetical protein